MRPSTTFTSPETKARDRRLAWRVALLAPLFGAPLWMLALADMPTSQHWSTGAGFVLALLLAAASYTDIRWKKIPNWITYSGVLWGVALNGLATLTASDGGSSSPWLERLGPIGAIESVMGAAGCFAAMLLVYRIAGSGAGDVKLAAAIGALMGLEVGVAAIVWAHLFAGLAILAWLMATRGPRRILGLLTRCVANVVAPTIVNSPSREDQQLMWRPVPLAAFFALAAFVVLGGGYLPW